MVVGEGLEEDLVAGVYNAVVEEADGSVWLATSLEGDEAGMRDESMPGRADDFELGGGFGGEI